MAAERPFTDKEQKLIEQFLTVPKDIKARRVIIHPDKTFHFKETIREGGRVINIAQDESEFGLASHVQAMTEGGEFPPLLECYWDFRNIDEQPWLQLLGEILAELDLPGEQPVVCTGIPATGDSLAKTYALACQKLGRNIEYRQLLQKELTDEGYQFLPSTETILGKGEFIWALDDIISYGTNSDPALLTLAKLGYHPLGLLTVIDHEKGGPKRLQEKGFACFSWRKASEVYKYLFLKGKLDYSLYQRLMGVYPRKNIFDVLCNPLDKDYKFS